MDYMEVPEDIGTLMLEVVPNDFDLEPFMEIHIVIQTKPSQGAIRKAFRGVTSK